MQHRKRKTLARVLGGTNGTRKSVTRNKSKRYRHKPAGGVVSSCLSPRELKDVARLCKKWKLNMSATVRILVLIGLKERYTWSEPLDALGGLGLFR